jgi:hypothetical protein
MLLVEPGDASAREHAQDELAKAWQHFGQPEPNQDVDDPEEATDERTRKHVRAVVADRANLSRFLPQKGIALAPAAHNRFLDALISEYQAAVRLLRRRAEGD